MLPALSVRQNEREVIGSVARICANVGLFFVIAGIVPITEALGKILGNPHAGYTAFAAIVVFIMWIGFCIPLFDMKEPKLVKKKQSHTSLKVLAHILFGNEQLLYTGISMSLFMNGC